MIYTPDLNKSQSRKKQPKKNWNCCFLTSHYLKAPIETLPINLKWSEIGSIICRPDLHNLQTRKKLAKKVTTNWKWPFLIFQYWKPSIWNMKRSQIWINTYTSGHLQNQRFNPHNLLTHKKKWLKKWPKQFTDQWKS